MQFIFDTKPSGVHRQIWRQQLNRELLEGKSLADLREIAKMAGIKSITKYRKGELMELILERDQAPAVQPEPQSAPQTPAITPTPAPEIPCPDTGGQCPGAPGASLLSLRFQRSSCRKRHRN